MSGGGQVEQVVKVLQAFKRGIEGVRVSVSMLCEHAQCSEEH